MDKNTWIGLGIAALCLVFVFGTKAPDQPQGPDPLLQSTMEIHDAAMAELAAMNRIGRQLKQEVLGQDSLSARADAIRAVLQQMQVAEEGMYAWMREYKAPDEPLDEAGKAYLEDQKLKISANYRDIQAALAAGQQIASVH